MSLSPGTRLGPYEIVAPIGAGGMGEVYRARDTKLDRDVAVKVLPAAVASNPDALARFEREAKAVAALSHPNILAIHDLGEFEGRRYAVMELLEGETLRERLSEGPIPPRKAAELARQAARGLAAAHEKGIVHRDLKPENLFVTSEGRVKVLDFGLARVAEETTHTEETRTSITQPGIVMGTIGYMSPEQAAGGLADHRSDLFSLGAVLFEMLSGRRAFQRETGAETMAAIIREDPPNISESARDVPPALERVVRRCLEKRPEERFQSATDLGFAIVNAVETTVTSAPAPVVDAPRPASKVGRVTALPLLIGLGIVVGWALNNGLRAPDVREPVRVRPLTFSGRDYSPAISPDRKMLAFTSDRDGISRIWLKQLGAGGEAPLTEGPDLFPKFSPDGSSILFVRGSESHSAYRVPIVGGQPRKIVDNVAEVDWSPDGETIGFVRIEGQSAIIGVVGATGGEVQELHRVEGRAAVGLRFRPDGRLSFCDFSGGNAADWEFVVLDVSGEEVERVTPGEGRATSAPLWSPSGRELVYAQADATLGSIANPMGRVLRRDLASGKEEILLWAPHLFPGLGFDVVQLAVAGEGRLVFDTFDLRQTLAEVPFGDRGRPVDRKLTSGNSRDRQPAYSPDGTRVIFSSNRSGNLDLWTIDPANGEVTQITDDAAADWDPGFMPDGESIVWSSDRGGNLEIWIADLDGGRARQLTRDGLDAENPTVTPDGWVVYASTHPEKTGLWRIRLDGSDAAQITAELNHGPEVSPDGKYAAYMRLNFENRRNLIRVVEIATGEPVPFEIEVPYGARYGNVVWGRTRWMPGGKQVVFVGQNDEGLSGVYVQDFEPGRDTTATRRPIAGFSHDFETESFGISPDGSRIVISRMVEMRSLMLAENVPGIE